MRLSLVTGGSSSVPSSGCGSVARKGSSKGLPHVAGKARTNTGRTAAGSRLPGFPRPLYRAAPSGKVNSSGNLSVTLTLKRKTRLTAKFPGDARYAPKTATSTAGARVKVSTALSGHYRTKYTWKHTYYYFHQSKDPLVTTTMTAYPGRKQLLQIQIYAEGVWQTTAKEYFKLDSTGRSAVKLTGTPPKGYRFRVRDSYVSGSGDSVNTTTYGAWKYFTFTS
ncbi:hypothetical protein ACWDGI_23200 [Streptomyces sp. NPDC001220]